MNISVKIDDKQVAGNIDKLLTKVSNLSPLMTKIGALYERRVMENFQNESSPDGTKWQRLSQPTLLIGLKKNKGFKKKGGLSAKGKRYITGKKILFETGDLSGSIHFQAGPSSVKIGTSGSIPYAEVHQFGGKAGRGRKVTIPARPYLAINDGGKMDLAEKDRLWILDLIQTEVKK